MNAQEGMKVKCARCHRPMTVKKEGQQYGPKCARMVAKQEAFWQHVEELHPEVKV